MSSSPTASSSPQLPLAGVRVFLHIRNPPPDHHRNTGNSAKAVLRRLRLQVQQLGASLALSEAAADLVVFHHGSPSLLSALQARFKAVVSPAYLTACMETHQRLSITPFTITQDEDVVAVTLSSSSGQRVSTRTSTSTPPQTSSTWPATASPEQSGSGAVPVSRGIAGKDTNATPSRRCAHRSSKEANATARDSGHSAAASTRPSRPPRLLDVVAAKDDEEVKGVQETTSQYRDGATCGETPSTSPSSSHPAKRDRYVEQQSHRCVSSTSTHAGVSAPQPATRVSGTASGKCHPNIADDAGKRRSPALSPVQGRHSTLNETSSFATPTLTPSHRRDAFASTQSLAEAHQTSAVAGVGSDSDTQAASPETSAAAEEFIRHVVLRSTATAAVTRRRGRPPRVASRPAVSSTNTDTNAGDGFRSLLLIDELSATHSVTTSKTDAADPFLCSGSSTPQQQYSLHLPATSHSVSCSELNSTVVTQSLASSAEPSVEQASSKPVQCSPCGAKRKSTDDLYAGEKKTRKAPPVKKKKREVNDPSLLPSATARKLPPRTPPQQQQPSPPPKQRCSPCNAKARRRRKTNVEAPVVGGHVEPSSELPLSMSFSDTTQLERLADDDAAGVCVGFFLDDNDDTDDAHMDVDATSVRAAFLRDVVEQLGGTVVDDSDEQWFGCRSTLAGGRSGSPGVHPRKTTHLVVSPHAVLTPGILYFKALGIAIVTPQWVYDAVALGGFPAVVPNLHAHPVFGDATAQEVVEHDTLAEREAAVPEELRCDVTDLLGEEECATEKRAVSSVSPHSSSRSNVATAAAGVRVAPTRTTLSTSLLLPPAGLSSTLRQLHKEVAEEYVPAGEQARRPFYRAIFKDWMFYLYVPPIDLAPAHPAARLTRHARHSYLGDVAAALEQATQLIRLLGGTVTRNLASTFLDVVVDLTGFYERTIEAGRQQQQHRALHESLSCAYHDALQRLSQVPAACAEALRPTSSGTNAPPIVGISWLLYSILQRKRASVALFLLPAHPLAAQLAAIHHHGAEAAETTTAAAVDAVARFANNYVQTSAAVTGTTVSIPTPTFSGTTTSSSDTSSPLAFAATPPAAPPSVTTTERAYTDHVTQESLRSSSSPWPSVVEVLALQKTAQGPQEARKDAMHQLNTQEIVALLQTAHLDDSSPLYHPVSAEGKPNPAASFL